MIKLLLILIIVYTSMCVVIFVKCYVTYNTMVPGMTIHRIDRLPGGSFNTVTGIVVMEGDEKYFVNSYRGEHTLITVLDIYNGRYELI